MKEQCISRSCRIKEGNMLHRIIDFFAGKRTRLFRANAGMAWQGTKTGNTLTGIRPIKLGIEGMPDLIGWRETEITSDMVGKKVAIFVGVEAKTANTRVTGQQVAFAKILIESGGEHYFIHERDMNNLNSIFES